MRSLREKDNTMRTGPSQVMPTKKARALWTAMLLALLIKTSEGWNLTATEEPDSTITFQLQATFSFEALEVRVVKMFYSTYDPSDGPVMTVPPATAEQIADDTWAYTSQTLPPLTSICVKFRSQVYVKKGPIKLTPEQSMGACGASNTSGDILSETTNYTGEMKDDGKCGDSAVFSIPISADMINNDYMILSAKVDMNAKPTPIVWVKMRSRDSPYGAMSQSYMVIVHGPPYTLFEIYECMTNLCDLKTTMSTSVDHSGKVELKVELINNYLYFTLNGIWTSVAILSTATMSKLILSGLDLEEMQDFLNNGGIIQHQLFTF
uniref:uncharacterized protein n=1 Tax=Myxine glutinosa TaxID=7769 RepID=UPI00358F5ABA